MKGILGGFLLMFGCVTQLAAAPVVGTYSLSDGVKINYDHNFNGQVGDIGEAISFFSDDSSWSAPGATLAAKQVGGFVPTSLFTGFLPYTSLSSTGQMLIKGDIWGEIGAVYTIKDTQAHGVGRVNLSRNDLLSDFSYKNTAGHVTIRAEFVEMPSFFADVSFDYEMNEVFYPDFSTYPILPGGERGVVSNFTLTVATVPEPAAVLLIGSGLLGVFGFSKRKALAV